MSRMVWWVLLGGCVALAAFILFLTLTRDDMPVRGFAVAGGVLVVAIYPLLKLRASRTR